MRSARRVCYAGTYERDYPRNRLVIGAMRDAGLRVEEAHAPVFEHIRDKGKLTGFAAVRLALRLVFAYLRLIPSVALRLLRCDVLMVGYIGQLDMLVLAPIARAMRRAVVFNPLVSLTDTLIEDRGRFRAGSVVGRVARSVDRLSMRLADVVLADTEENADYFAARFEIERSRFAVVQAGAPQDVFYPAQDARCTGSMLDVLFVGKFIPLHGVETILRAAALLEEGRLTVRIELVGTGQAYDAARALADRLELKSIIWTDWIPFARLGERLRAADVALGIFDDGPKAARVIPNKVHQALASGTAVITRESPAMTRVLGDSAAAVLVPPADPPALAAAIERLMDAEERRRLGEAGYRSWLEWGSQAALAQQVSAVFARLDEQS